MSLDLNFYLFIHEFTNTLIVILFLLGIFKILDLIMVNFFNNVNSLIHSLVQLNLCIECVDLQYFCCAIISEK